MIDPNIPLLLRPPAAAAGRTTAGVSCEGVERPAIGRWLDGRRSARPLQRPWHSLAEFENLQYRFSDLFVCGAACRICVNPPAVLIAGRS